MGVRVPPFAPKAKENRYKLNEINPYRHLQGSPVFGFCLFSLSGGRFGYA